ncbi:MAG: AAA family ATPase [Deltaproteobacteria bacterium]|nr:AAA family ATPase [Deltaproteobacteria bacterium]
MRVTRFSRIKGYRVFRDFIWPAELLPFGQFNLIYGWNGTGKTTLAALLRHLQDRTAVRGGDVVFELDGKEVAASDVPSALLPAVRVFNREFVAATVLSSAGEIAPIYYLGQDSVEKQQQVEKLKKDLTSADTKVATAKSEKTSAEKALDDYCIAKAKVIKELLISSRTPEYNNYDKRRFRQAVEQLNAISQPAALLCEADKAKLRSQKDAQTKNSVSTVIRDVPDFVALTASTEALLKRSVASKVIEELASNREVSSWVQRGLELHTGDRDTVQCRFCGQQIARARLVALEAHFNDEFSHFQSDVNALASRIEQNKKVLVELQMPESSRFYDHLATEIDAAMATARGLIEQSAGFLESLHSYVIRKRESPFQPSSLNGGPPAPDREAIIGAIAAINAVVDQHNAITTRFQKEVDRACQQLEQCYVAEGFEEFCRFRQAIETAEASLVTASSEAQGLRDRIGAIEREIVEHRRPAEELNAELRAYLGRDDLRFEVRETGYGMTRNGQPASDLSEGEKTAIAFLYFLKSLQDKSFDLPNGVVVIDDPVSSLDSNSLFSAFSYMKERTKNCDQLIVMTHNFGFFRQVKNWFHHVNRTKCPAPERPRARFFLLRAVGNGKNQRTASIGAIDPMLEEFDSEYHYLFKRVVEEAERKCESVPLGDQYSIPNLARRLVEAFLSFRYPDYSGNNALYHALERVNFDESKKTRILRFVHTYSHSGQISPVEEDPWGLSETTSVLCDILEMIRTEDPAHFDGMTKRIGIAKATT